ncbi:ABC transporter ATP-binding protein [Oceanirhabdus sp. W0125-5]|uniref:ABC transporter ATP-binding protein n=1 Tax=Oceanirhabdus sp. W0125-5 TaxID=2999116 RepID=UPI0022F2CEE2|nr:ABC transporter ATP-binding protein [Oceanirhabdus sp. W0125-5]WBW98101.1 ABC transporter ATP-binding protein [Oceanirhabdus sp. W0125-5]
MRDKIIRFFRLCSYFSSLEPRYFPCVILFNMMKSVRPFVNLYLSKCIIDLIFMNMSLTEIMKYVWSMILINLLMMVAEGYFQSRSQYHDFNLIRNHDMMKAKKLMNLNYELVEDDSLQDSIVELQYLEMTGIYNFPSFGKSIGNFFGGLVGVLISLFFSIEFFKADFTFRGLNNGVMNFIFLVIFILLNTLSFKVISKSNKEAGNFTRNTGNGIFRYIRSYMNIIYNYRTGKDIRLYDMNLAENAGEVYTENMCHIYSTFWRKLGKGTTISEILSSILSVIIFMFVGMKALYGVISVGQIMLYIGAINNIFKNASEIVKSLSIIIPSDLYREKLFRFMDLNESEGRGEISVEKGLGSKCEIEFKSVSFKYPGTDKYVLKNINLKFKPGQRLAIVGMNGSGKTTLIKLLLGLYDPTEGEITLNGKNIRNYKQDEYLDIFSVVFQDFKLLSLALGENVAASREYDHDEVRCSLQKVGLSKFLERNDLNTYLYREFDENGVEISGGEAQKIAMARAIYKKGRFIVLDEPTAALDPISEFEIYSKFNNIIGDNTAVYISHRLSSCRFCDNICVLNEGVLVQYGSHGELMADSDGKYYELWSSQAKHYKEK